MLPDSHDPEDVILTECRRARGREEARQKYMHGFGKSALEEQSRECAGCVAGAAAEGRRE